MLQGSSLPDFLEAEFSVMSFGIIPSWEIQKREVVQDDVFVSGFNPVCNISNCAARLHRQ